MEECFRLVYYYSMHEMSLAMKIVEIAVRQATAVGAGRITGIELAVGALAGVQPDSLTFCFEAAAMQTLAAGAHLTIRRVDGCGRCSPSDRSWPAATYFARCPTCGASLEGIAEGQDLRIEAITIDEDEESQHV